MVAVDFLYDCKLLGNNATDDVCRLLLYYYIYADEWTAAPCGLNAVMGTALYADAATTLLCRDTALGLSERYHNCRTMDELCRPRHLCSHFQHSCCHHLQETSINKGINDRYNCLLYIELHSDTAHYTEEHKYCAVLI